MLFLISSNIISGAYTVFELLSAFVLAQLLSAIAGILNVKAIYEDRQKIALRNSNISVISNHGLTTSRVHLVTNLIFVIVTLLMTTGQFAIIGVTETEYENVTVKYLVKKEHPGHVLNVLDHVSLEKKKVSNELLLLYHASKCRRATTSSVEYYQYIYEGEGNIERLKNDVAYGVLNVSCVTSDFGFENKTALKQLSLPQPGTQSEDIACEWAINENKMPRKTITRASLNASSGCAKGVKEGWCYLDDGASCAALLEYKEGLGLGVFVYNRLYKAMVSELLQPGEDFGTEKLKAMVLLLYVGFPHDLGTHLMLSLRVERNGTLRKVINPSREATRINVPLFTATVLPAVTILLLTLIAAVYMWAKVICVPGRQGYNRFNSAIDLLSCAAVEKFKDGGCRYTRSGRIAVGLDESGEHASPVRPSSKVTE